MRDKFFRLIRAIQRDPDYRFESVSLGYLHYSENGENTHFEITRVEYNLLLSIHETFFAENHRDFIPNLESDDIELELFAHTFPKWASDCGNTEIIWVPGKDNQSLGDYLGPYADHDFQITMHMRSGSFSKDFVSFQQESDNILRVWPLVGDDIILRDIVASGFPLPYLSGLASDPCDLNWDHVSFDVVNRYITYFASSAEEKKQLFIAAL